MVSRIPYTPEEDPSLVLNEGKTGLQKLTQSLRKYAKDIMPRLIATTSLSSRGIQELLASSEVRKVAKKLGLPGLLTLQLLFTACTPPAQVQLDSLQNQRLGETMDRVNTLEQLLLEALETTVSKDHYKKGEEQTMKNFQAIKESLVSVEKQQRVDTAGMLVIVNELRREIAAQLAEQRGVLESHATTEEVVRLEGLLMTLDQAQQLLDVQTGAQFTSVEQQIGSTQAQVETALESIASLEGRLVSQIQEVADYLRENDALLRSGVTTALSTLEEHEDWLTSMGHSMEEYRYMSQQLTVDVSMLYSHIGNFYDNLNRLESQTWEQHWELQRDLEVMEININYLQQSVEAVHGSITELFRLQAQEQQLRQEDGAFYQHQLQNLWSNIENFSTVFGDVYANLTQLEGRVDALEQ